MAADRGEWAPITNAKDLGAFLQRTRRRRSITQDELAADLGISRSYLSEIEQGKPGLYTDRLFAVMRDLGVTLRAEAR